MLAAHEGRRANPVLMPERQRQQQQRPSLDIAGDDDEGLDVFTRADM